MVTTADPAPLDLVGGKARSLMAMTAQGLPVPSGFVLAVPVFFDTVFYLLVPLARSLHRRTGKRYLLYILAIACGGAITHTLVPPTPGPLWLIARMFWSKSCVPDAAATSASVRASWRKR